MSNPEITIKYDDQSVEVFYNQGSKHFELAYISKDTRFDDLAEMLDDCFSAVGVECEIVRAEDFY